MASLTLRDMNQRWPEGTSLTIRPASNFGSSTPPVPGQAPLGSATDTQTVSGDAVTFTGLADDTAYVVTDASGTKYLQTGTLISHGAVVKTDSTGHIREADLPATAELTGHKAAASGYASLDSSTRVPAAQLGRVTEPLWGTGGFTVYVNNHDGSDSNSGRSPGEALQTLAPAVAMLNQSVHGGRIVISGPDGGVFTATEGLHFVRGIHVQAVSPYGAEIDRGFDTSASRSFWDAVTTAAGSSVTSATASAVAGDVNKIIAVYGAGTGGGTFYDFISAVPNGTTFTLTGTTPIARPSATDTQGVKGQVVGDWNRVVTDAAMTAASGVVTSATAVWTDADIGREVVVAGAGRGNQALRSAILSRQSATQVTLCGKATNTVSGKRCAIGVNFGDLFTFHVPNCGLEKLYLYDPTTDHRARIGAAIKMVVDDGYPSSTGQHVIDDLIITNSDTQSAWEHDIDIDGSWNQTVGGGGVRKVSFKGGTFFGARRPTETIRINTAVHTFFVGGGLGGSAPIAGSGADAVQGIMILDPKRTSGGSTQTADVHFTGFEGIDADLWVEGQYVTFTGGRIGWTGTQPSGRRSVDLTAAASDCMVVTENVDTAEDAQKDQTTGNNNTIRTNQTDRVYDWGTQAGPYTITPTSTRGGVRRIKMTSGTLTFAQPSGAAPRGTILCFDIENATGGVMTISWSGAYKKAAGYAPPADTKRHQINFRFDGSNWIQTAAVGPDI